MNAKLTLTLDKALIDQTKKFAKSAGKSPSTLIAGYLESLSEDKAVKENAAAAPIVNSLRGAFTEPTGFKPKKGPKKSAAKTTK